MFVFHPWYDLDLVTALQGLTECQDGPRRLYVLHAIGSHWFFNNHVPDLCAHFRPVATNRVITQNDSAAIINSYDGENGNWLHAAGAEATKYPAALVWYSDKYAQRFPDKVAALKENRTKHYRTDYLFYSILSAAGMEAAGNSPSFDLFSPE